MISTRCPACRRAACAALVGVDVQPVLLADLATPLVHRTRIEAPDVPERHVLPHGQGFDEAEVLVDHADAVRCRLDRVVDAHRYAVEADGGSASGRTSLIRTFISVDLLGRSSARMPCTRPRCSEIDAVAGHDAAEALGDPDQLDGGGTWSPPANCSRPVVISLRRMPPRRSPRTARRSRRRRSGRTPRPWPPAPPASGRRSRRPARGRCRP